VFILATIIVIILASAHGLLRAKRGEKNGG